MATERIFLTPFKPDGVAPATSTFMPASYPCEEAVAVATLLATLMVMDFELKPLTRHASSTATSAPAALFRTGAPASSL